MKPYKRRYGLSLINVNDGDLFYEQWSIVEIKTKNIVFNYDKLRHKFNGTPFGEYINDVTATHDIYTMNGFQILEHICNYLNRETDDRLLYLSNINEYCI